ncbi:hypothetical protein [Streptomyces sp. URMC 129]|uniref:hypothetical protein n=1 Tax=Streptomyces sp. URMC 129 TaxID=3423407 RepID=UPI003F1D3AFB
MLSENCSLHIAEYAEISTTEACALGVDYERMCAMCAVMPHPAGWGLLHCREESEGRRVTLATSDVAHHRMLAATIDAAKGTLMEEKTRRLLGRTGPAGYAYARDGWPDDWARDLSHDPLPWHAISGGQMQKVGSARVFHITPEGASEGDVIFMIDDRRAAWTMLCPQDRGGTVYYGENVMVSASYPRVQWLAASWVAVQPGWPLRNVKPYIVV